MNENNLILLTDSYKLTHWNQYPEGTEAVYSYFESREGAEYPYTLFFGLQALLWRYMETPVTRADVEEAEILAQYHFGINHPSGESRIFNNEGWTHIVEDHHGVLPLKIKAVPEGSVIPTSNVLMTVENTCPECYWLTNAMESLLTHVWYPSTVATMGLAIKRDLIYWLDKTGCTHDGLDFMLHDFGYRGVSSNESARLGGMAHLVNFQGTDTLAAMIEAATYYDADFETLAFSVPATEHSVMTSLGKDGEPKLFDDLLDKYPTGILSVVIDSYNWQGFLSHVIERKEEILARDGTLVLRPDSGEPADVTLRTVARLAAHFPTTTNEKSFIHLDPHVKVLWGDGIDRKGVNDILRALHGWGFAADNMVFGMGGALLQKVNRDTQRFAFKCSAQKRDGYWHNVWKDPVDGGKSSKRGRLVLEFRGGEFKTRSVQWRSMAETDDDILRLVYENGIIWGRSTSFDAVRETVKQTQDFTVLTS